MLIGSLFEDIEIKEILHNVLWCNGNTSDFGSEILSSSLDRTTKYNNMEKINILTITDKSRIKNVTCKYPELYNPSIVERLKEDYYEMLETKKTLHNLRMEALRYENLLKEKSKEFNEKYALFDIEFETYNKEYITEKSGLSFGNLGNDLIGKQY